MKQKRVSSILRALVGIYLFYLAYGLLDEFHLKGLGEGNVTYMFGFLYLVIGIVLFLWGGIGYYKASRQEKEDTPS